MREGDGGREELDSFSLASRGQRVAGQGPSDVVLQLLAPGVGQLAFAT